MSNWYVAYALVLVYFREGRQQSFPGWENIILVQADSMDKAEQIVKSYLKEDTVDDPSFSWGGRPAKLVFKGLRKIMRVISVTDVPELRESPIEISYSEIEIDSEEDVNAFLQGKPVRILIDEPSNSN